MRQVARTAQATNRNGAATLACNTLFSGLSETGDNGPSPRFGFLRDLSGFRDSQFAIPAQRSGNATVMIHFQKAQHILWYQSFGFLLIIALSWMDELLKLPARIFGAVAHSNWRESAMQTAVVLAVWLPIFLVTRRILLRLYYLEGFLRVCAWCRQIGHDADWLPVEQYFAQGFDIKTSHGICPECARTHFPKPPQL